jgi:hypothetical protein
VCPHATSPRKYSEWVSAGRYGKRTDHLSHVEPLPREGCDMGLKRLLRLGNARCTGFRRVDTPWSKRNCRTPAVLDRQHDPRAPPMLSKIGQSAGHYSYPNASLSATIIGQISRSQACRNITTHTRHAYFLAGPFRTEWNHRVRLDPSLNRMWPFHGMR